ncbi:MAG: hypothetical protein AAF545_00010 [Pseudomonadota bacterium]
MSEVNSRKSPFESKVRDYLEQRSNSYGENDKSSRKAIRFRKKWVNRDYRRAVAQHSRGIGLGSEGEDFEFGEIGKKHWRKSPDSALIEDADQMQGSSSKFRRKSSLSPAQKEALRRLRQRKGPTRLE